VQADGHVGYGYRGIRGLSKGPNLRALVGLSSFCQTCIISCINYKILSMVALTSARTLTILTGFSRTMTVKKPPLNGGQRFSGSVKVAKLCGLSSLGSDRFDEPLAVDILERAIAP
jgi:hypothetical protein